jgi:competence protein ComEC
MAGIAGGVIVDVAPPLACTLALSASWTALLFAYRRGYPRLQLGAALALVAAVGWLLGAHALGAALHAPLRAVLEQRYGGFAMDAPDAVAIDPVIVEGRLLEDAAVDESGTTLRIDVSSIAIDGQVLPTGGGVAVGVGGSQQTIAVTEWTAGRRLRLPVILRRPARYLNEGLGDQERDLARRGISLVGSVKSARLVEVLASGRWWEEAAAAMRRDTRAALARHVRSSGAPSTAIATAILIGDRSGLDPETERQLQQAGTYHVIAISGGNIAILAALILGALGGLGLRGRFAAVATLAVLAAYAIVASGGASVARATLTAGIYLAVRLIDQRMRPANVVTVTAAIVLLASPLAIIDVGFWLTFGATAAILVGLSWVRLPPNPVARGAVAVLASSAFVELALAPIAAMVFERVTAAGLALNFAALPAMTVVQLAAMAVVACDAIGLGAMADWLGRLVDIGSLVLTNTARWVDFAPWVTWRVPSPHALVVAAYYVTAIGTLVLASRNRVAVAPVRATLPRRRRLASRACAAAATALFLWIAIAPHARIRSRGDVVNSLPGNGLNGIRLNLHGTLRTSLTSCSACSRWSLRRTT